MGQTLKHLLSFTLLAAVFAMTGYARADAGDPPAPAAAPPFRVAQEAPPQPAARVPAIRALAVSVVPDLYGRTVSEAQELLEKSGLRLGEVARVAARQAPGSVVRQSPQAKETTKRGAAVNVWIAEAPTVKAPRLIGLPLKQAEAILARGGFRLGSVGRTASKESEGTVVRQNPDPGSPVERGSSLDVWIAEAPPVQVLTVKVPELRKRQVKEAAALLARSRLRLGDVTSTPSDAPEGTVLRQSPSAGQSVEPGSSVSVEVAAAPASAVPNVVGRPLKDAGAMLAKSGFSMREAGREESRVPEGAVARQSPAPGESANKGTVVNVWVAVAAISTVPDLRGLSAAGAEQRLRESRLRLGAQSTQPSLPPGGEVVGQKPAPGEKLRVGAAVDVVLGDGSQARVPALVGRTERAARDALERAALRPGRATSEESARPEGEVLRQRPAEGTVVGRESVVDYWIAAPQKVAVPRIIGRRAAEAMAELRRLELAGEQAGAEESSRPEGEILRQQPAPGSRVPRGSRVGFWVASPMLVTVPDLSRMQESAAAERLLAAQLVAGRIEPEESREPAGSVLRQEPAPGARVPRGTPVNTWVATPMQVPVPGLVGLGADNARARLSELGLMLSAQPPERNDAPEGTIVAQEPPQGARVPLGTDVVVRVSAGPPPTWPWVAGGGIGAALLAAGAGLLWARRPKPAPTPAPQAPPTVRVRVEAPDATLPDRLPMDANVPEIRVRSSLVSGDSEVAAEKLVMREERRET